VNLHISDKVNYKSNRHYKKEDSNANKKDTANNKLIYFIYVGKETKCITKLFRYNNINISYKTKNTIENFLRTNNRNVSTNIKRMHISTITPRSWKPISEKTRKIF
jgi:hypothetical protein